MHREVYLLGDPVKEFQRKYKFLMSSHLYKQRFEKPSEEAQNISKIFNTCQTFIQYYPNEILEGLLYLGDANHATSAHVMKNMKITHIVNVTDVIPNAFEGPKI